MKQIMRMVKGIMFMALWGGCLLYGVLTNNAGLTRIGLLYAWLMFIVSLLISLQKAAKEKAVSDYKPRLVIHSVIYCVFAIAYTLFLVYCGYVVTAFCFMFAQLVFIHVATESKAQKEKQRSTK